MSKRIKVTIPDRMYDQLIQAAREANVPMTAVVRMAIVRFFVTTVEPATSYDSKNRNNGREDLAPTGIDCTAKVTP